MIQSTASRTLSRRGQATVEYAMLFVGIVMPFTFGLIAISQLLWTWHSVVEFTRLGARYATTHCWQPGGSNVLAYMRTAIPPMLDSDVMLNGPAEIQVLYFKKNPDTGQYDEFTCDGECSSSCIPDRVSVSIRNYEFRRFLNYVGLPPVQMPVFSAAMPIESAGCDPEQGICLP